MENIDIKDVGPVEALLIGGYQIMVKCVGGLSISVEGELNAAEGIFKTPIGNVYALSDLVLLIGAHVTRIAAQADEALVSFTGGFSIQLNRAGAYEAGEIHLNGQSIYF